MVTVKAIYEDGNIKLLEDVPLREKQHLLVTLVDDVEKGKLGDGLLHPRSFHEYLQDKREDLYQDFLNTDR